MKTKSQSRFPLLRDDKIFSFVEMLKVMSVVVLVTFIIGLVFGLKAGSGSKKAGDSVVDSSANDIGYSDSYFSSEAPTPRRSEPARGEYRQEAEAVVDLWERETGEKMTESDVLFMEALMKNTDSRK